jgi:hypothetical protein
VNKRTKGIAQFYRVVNPFSSIKRISWVFHKNSVFHRQPTLRAINYCNVNEEMIEELFGYSGGNRNNFKEKELSYADPVSPHFSLVGLTKWGIGVTTHVHGEKHRYTLNKAITCSNTCFRMFCSWNKSNKQSVQSTSYKTRILPSIDIMRLSAFRPRGVPGPMSKLSPRVPAQMGRRETEHEGGKEQAKRKPTAFVFPCAQVGCACSRGFQASAWERGRESESLMRRPVLPRGQPSRTRALDLPFIGVRRGSRCTLGGVAVC